MKQLFLFIFLSAAFLSNTQAQDSTFIRNDTLYTKNLLFYPNQVLYIGKPVGYTGARGDIGFTYIKSIKYAHAKNIKKITITGFESLNTSEPGSIYAKAKVVILFNDGSSLKSPLTFEVNNAIEKGELKLTP
ncbi:MAG: hypothetical protein JST87_12240 [Bacteroidetes bacterium]|nr:hypothetical protein [Bacteroidota bacterium]